MLVRASTPPACSRSLTALRRATLKKHAKHFPHATYCTLGLSRIENMPIESKRQEKNNRPAPTDWEAARRPTINRALAWSEPYNPSLWQVRSIWFQYYFIVISILFQYSFNIISILLQYYFNIISILLQYYFNIICNIISILFQYYFNIISISFHYCFNSFAGPQKMTQQQWTTCPPRRKLTVPRTPEKSMHPLNQNLRPAPSPAGQYITITP